MGRTHSHVLDKSIMTSALFIQLVTLSKRMITKTHTLSTRRRLSPSFLMRPRFILIRFRNRKFLKNINVPYMVSKRRGLNRISVRLLCFCRTICSNETTNRAENWAYLWCLNDHDLDGLPQRCRAQCIQSRILKCDSIF